MGCGLAGTPARPTCFSTMIHANANGGSRISCRAVPAMPLPSASSVLNCSQFELTWTPDTERGGVLAALGGSNLQVRHKAAPYTLRHSERSLPAKGGRP